MINDELKHLLQRLGLNYLAHNLSDFIARSTKNRASAQEMIEDMAHCETQEKHQRGLARRVASAKLGRYRPLTEFDWAWPKHLPKEVVDHLMRLAFIEEPANVILVGPSGTGKTMIAKNLAYEAVMAGRSVLFCEAADMLSDLEQQESPRALRLRLSRYVKPDLLVVDEVGYLSYSGRAADLMFQVVSKRHEKAATIITTNVSFKDWPQIFPGAACVVAMLDRLTHRAEIIAIDSESYRKREATARREEKPKSGIPTKPAKGKA